jgi:transketolase
MIDYHSISNEIRRISLIMAHNANSSHSGGALSMADILAVLYSGYISITPKSVDDPNRDRFLLSKGHCCASLYATLAVNGFLDKDELLNNYGKNGGKYFTHVSHKLNGVEMSSGSLGHGLPVACGIAVSGQVSRRDFDTYCLTGDGELQEGSCWESILFAAHHKLSHLCLIVDYNKIQSMGDVKAICDISPLADKFKAFNWNVIEIDGHDYHQIENAFLGFKKETEKPTVIIANTIKGKGVSYMEGELLWHYRTPNDEQLKIALEELK